MFNLLARTRKDLASQLSRNESFDCQLPMNDFIQGFFKSVSSSPVFHWQLAHHHSL